MSKVQTLRAFVKQRLSLAAEEIFELFERTIAEYEEQLCRQNKLLDAVFKPQLQLHRADVQLQAVSKDQDPPEQQDWSSSLDQEDPPELPHIKEEQEELWTNQEGEQLQGLEEAEIIKFTFNPVAVKSEEDDDEEEPQSSQLHQTDTDEETSEPDSDHSFDREETRKPRNSSENNKVLVSDVDCDTRETPVDSSECAAGDETRQSGAQTGLKSFSCSVCGKKYPQQKSLIYHMRIHSSKRFSCSVCKKSFQWRRDVVTHMRVHTGENPFTCSVCGKGFAYRSHLTFHSRVHTGEKPFGCSVCNKSFSNSSALKKHTRVHTGEKPFSCSVCGKKFALAGNLSRHLTVHTGEKPFSCSFCDKKFTQKSTLNEHLTLHTGEKQFVCSVCGKKFSRLTRLNKHKCVGESSGSRTQQDQSPETPPH